MTMLFTAIKRFGVGLLYGAGFAVGSAIVAVILFFGGMTLFSFGGGRVSVSSPHHQDSPPQPDRFVITNTNVVKQSWGSLNVVGTIKNTGNDTGRYVNVYADLFDKSGKFIYQCMKQFSDGLRKDETANFMIECHGMPKEITEAYDSFKVHARGH